MEEQEQAHQDALKDLIRALQINLMVRVSSNDDDKKRIKTKIIKTKKYYLNQALLLHEQGSEASLTSLKNTAYANILGDLQILNENLNTQTLGERLYDEDVEDNSHLHYRILDEDPDLQIVVGGARRRRTKCRRKRRKGRKTRSKN